MVCEVSGCNRKVRTKNKCASCYAAQWNRDNKQRYNLNGRNWYRSKDNAETKRRRERERSCKRYGITLEQYEELFNSQLGLCAICYRPERSRLKVGGILRSLAVDHDHSTKKVRGLLCTSCNRGLGKFGDDSDNLRKAADYLEAANATD